MKTPYLKSNNSYQSYFNRYYLALIPLIFYGLYKNIILNYQKASFIYLLKPLLLIIIGLGIGLLVEYLYQKFYLKKPFKEYNRFIPLYSLITCMVIPIDCNYLLLTLILFVAICFCKFFKLDTKVNVISLLLLILIISLNLFNLSTYASNYETAGNLSLSYFNIFMGRSIGGTFTTSNFWCLVSFIILTTTPVYKKDIPLYIIITSLILMVIYSLISYDYNLWQLFLSGFTIFGAVFIAPQTLTSSYTKKGKIIYSVLIALLNFILIVFLHIYYGIFIAIFLVSLGNKIFDRKFVI